MSDFDDLIDKDITASVTVGDEEEPDNTESDQNYPDESGHDEDHPALALIDIGIDESARYCKKEGLPEPNLSLWHNFSRGYLNRALWHYAPDGDLPDSPAIALLLGMGGLGVCYMPVIMAVYRKHQEEDKGGKDRIPPRSPPEKEIRTKPAPEEPRGEIVNMGGTVAARIAAMEAEAQGYGQ